MRGTAGLPLVNATRPSDIELGEQIVNVDRTVPFHLLGPHRCQALARVFRRMLGRGRLGLVVERGKETGDCLL